MENLIIIILLLIIVFFAGRYIYSQKKAVQSVLAVQTLRVRIVRRDKLC